MQEILISDDPSPYLALIWSLSLGARDEGKVVVGEKFHLQTMLTFNICVV
jgi:hypothetical protein